MTVDLSQFLPTFFEESFEGIQIMESALLALEPDNKEAINCIFRAAHSIKGGAGTFGLIEVSEFTHLVETLLDELRDGRRKLTDQDKELLLKATDAINALLVSAKNDGSPVTIDVDAITKALNHTLEHSPEQESNQAENTGWQITFIPDSDIAQTGNDPLLLFNALRELGDLNIICNHELLPDFDKLDPEEIHLSWVITLLNNQVTVDEIEEVFEWVEDECKLVIEPIKPLVTKQIKCPLETKGEVSLEQQSDIEPPTKLDDSKADISVVKPEQSKPKVKADAGSIRVGVDKVDSLINLVGELVITQSMLSELGQHIESSQTEQLKAGLEQLLQNTKELQESVMRIRMLPISFTFNRFPRLVHDLAIKMDKKINLSIEGENTELDKTVLERIGDPLTHLIRNAIDHGIESVEQRKRAGKAETGEISLSAYHLGGNVVIEIRDDGQGINQEAILQKAIEKNLVDASYPLNEQQIFDLIFEPGFSTADKVSDISGRGVGMDVVKRNIQSLGGRIVIESAVGNGSTFKVYLPLTLAILDGQLVRVCNETFIVPLLVIVESLQIDMQHVIKASGGQLMYRLRDDNVPIVTVGSLFNLCEQESDLSESLLVVAESEGQKIGILVDDLLGQQQVVIKSLQDNYLQVTGISGATILGTGAVALILDIAGVITLAQTRRSAKHKYQPLEIDE